MSSPDSRAKVPASLALHKLTHLPTGALATSLTKALPDVTDSAVHAFLAAGADDLAETAKQRNHALHARPATVDGQQRLYRWTDQGTIAFAIDDAWLDVQIADLDDRIQ